MIFELCCITLLALIALLLCVILERAKETKELNVRIATALSLLAPKMDKILECATHFDSAYPRHLTALGYIKDFTGKTEQHTKKSLSLAEGGYNAIAELVKGQNLSLSALEDLNDKLDALIAERAAEEKPGSPDLDEERSEADKAAEKAFSEGVLAILNYDATSVKEAKD